MNSQMNKNKLRNNQNGVIHHLALFVLLGLVLAGVSFAGWRVWQGRDSANAYNWSTIGGQGYDSGVYACKLDLGSTWHLKAYVKNNKTTGFPWRVVSYSSGTEKTLLSGTIGSRTKTNVHYTSSVPKSVAYIKSYYYAMFAGNKFKETNSGAYSIKDLKNCM